MPGGVLFFDCYSGISGDMILGALLDLGVDFKALQRELQKLNLKGYEFVVSKESRGFITGTRVKVRVRGNQHGHRTFAHIKTLLQESKLSRAIKTQALAVFTDIARAEAEIHGVPIDHVHFHEIGAIDSIIDVVGSAICFDQLRPDAVYASPLNTGEGTVPCEHGVLPVPAPATLKLLRGIPCYSSGIRKELTTPTGAAVIAACAQEFGPMPPMKVMACGYGVGGHVIPELPNMLRVVMGESVTAKASAPLLMLETNIDDMNPEHFPHVMELLFAAGAVDVFFTPIVMKKNRPAVKLSALIPQGKERRAAELIFRETSTFGVRFYPVERICLEREILRVPTEYGAVRVKTGRQGREIVGVAPEYEDCRRLARAKKVPLKRIYDAALRAARQRLSDDAPEG